MVKVELAEMREDDAIFFRGVRSMLTYMEQNCPSICRRDMTEPPEPFNQLGVMR
jgi:hypothetical protein